MNKFSNSKNDGIYPNSYNPFPWLVGIKMDSIELIHAKINWAFVRGAQCPWYIFFDNNNSKWNAFFMLIDFDIFCDTYEIFYACTQPYFSWST